MGLAGYAAALAQDPVIRVDVQLVRLLVTDAILGTDFLSAQNVTLHFTSHVGAASNGCVVQWPERAPECVATVTGYETEAEIDEAIRNKHKEGGEPLVDFNPDGTTGTSWNVGVIPSNTTIPAGGYLLGRERRNITLADICNTVGGSAALPASATSGPATARCLILVTPDAQRTMNT